MTTRRTFLKRLATGAAGLAAWAAPGRLGRTLAQAQTPTKPNIVFILVDDMGWTDPACYGSDLHETPNIDGLARRGMRFTNAYAACPVCSPTRASILTGKYPARLNLTDWIAGHKRPFAKLRVPEFNQQLPLEETTIAEALKPAGYASASIGKWHLGAEPYYPEKQGFDVNIAGTRWGSPGPTGGYFRPERIPTMPPGHDGQYLADALADEAEKFIEANRDRPFFLYLPHYVVHTPIQGKKDVVEKYKGRLRPGLRHKNPTYAAMVESVDDSVGRIVAKLDALGLADRTVLFFMSDNGGLVGPTNNAPLRAGKGTLYEGGIREPMIVTWPGVVPPGTTEDVPVTSVDFYPTILAIAGVAQAKPDPTVDGRDFTPLLRRDGQFPTGALYWHYPHYHPGGATPGGAIRRDDWKLIEFFEDNRVELYNLKDDLGEKRDLAAEQPERARALGSELAAWRRRVGARMPTPNPDYDPARGKQGPPRAKKAKK